MDIWIEAEHWAPGEWSTEDDNSDVIVTLDDGSRWSSTFFTFSNVASLREKYRLSGECLAGRYLYATNMILVDVLTREHICATVQDLLATGDFAHAFQREEPEQTAP